MDGWMSLASTATDRRRNILVEYFGYSTRIFYVFNIDGRKSPTPTAGAEIF